MKKRRLILFSCSELEDYKWTNHIMSKQFIDKNKDMSPLLGEISITRISKERLVCVFTANTAVKYRSSILNALAISYNLLRQVYPNILTSSLMFFHSYGTSTVSQLPSVTTFCFLIIYTVLATTNKTRGELEQYR